MVDVKLDRHGCEGPFQVKESSPSQGLGGWTRHGLVRPIIETRHPPTATHPTLAFLWGSLLQ